MKRKKPKRPQTRADILNPGFGIPPLKRNEVQEMIRESAFPREKMMVDRIKKIESKLGMAGTEPECTCLKTGWQPLECPVHPRDRFGVAGTERSCVGRCGGLARKDSNYCQACRDERILAVVGEKASDLPAEPECTCPHSLLDCPLCKPDSDLPLKARVAMALGWQNCDIHGHDYYGHPPNDREFKAWGSTAPKNSIPDYDKHVDLAMGAAEDYCSLLDTKYPDNELNEISINISARKCSAYVDQETGRPEPTPEWIYCDGLRDLPQAICEAIVKHAETQ